MARVTSGGDERRLRGIPAVSRGTNWGPAGNRPTAGSAGEAVATRTLEAAVPVSCWDCSADMNVVGSACSGSSARWDAAAVLEVQVREHAVPVDRGDASGGFSGSRSTRSGRLGDHAGGEFVPLLAAVGVHGVDLRITPGATTGERDLLSVG